MFWRRKNEFYFVPTKMLTSSFSTNQSIKVEKGNQRIAGGSISESIFSNETIALHCKIIISKLLENLFDIANVYQYSIFQLNHQKYLWKLVPFETCHNMLDCFTYISISHLYTRVNLIAFTKFHCLNCTIIVGKFFIYTETCF